MTSAVPQMSLADVARFAGVQRPVVSMWRRRELTGNPFPQPVAIVGSQERFDAFEIADYLAATRRGNSTVEREDVAAHAALACTDGLDQAKLFDGLTALLALDALTGEALCERSADELRSLALEADPDDTVLTSEVDAVGAALADRGVCRINSAAKAFLRVGEVVVLRFADPEGRADRAGRIIRHDFVVFGARAEQLNSVEDGIGPCGPVWPMNSPGCGICPNRRELRADVVRGTGEHQMTEIMNQLRRKRAPRRPGPLTIPTSVSLSGPRVAWWYLLLNSLGADD